MVSYRARGSLLLLLFLAFMTASTAQVEFHPGTVANVTDATVNLTDLAPDADWVRIMPDNVTIDNLVFNVTADTRLDVDMKVFNQEAIQGGTVARFVANAPDGTTATFTLQNLIPDQTYNVSRNGTPIALKGLSGDMLTFSSTLSPHTFTVRMIITGGLTASEDTITTTIGETVSSSLLLTNPKEEADTYTVTADTQMDAGNAIVTLDTGAEEGEEVTVEVDAESTRAITINVEGSSCLGTACTGDTTFIARSQTTDERYTEVVDIIVRRSTRLHGSPGITLPYIFLIAAIGGLTILLRGGF